MSDDKQSITNPHVDPNRKGRRINLSIPDEKYMELLIKIRHENLNWKKFFTFMIDGFIEDDPGIMDYIDSQMADIRTKRRTKILKKERQAVQETISVFGLDDEEIDDIYDILEEEFDP
jgi:hypothetical protein